MYASGSVVVRQLPPEVHGGAAERMVSLRRLDGGALGEAELARHVAHELEKARAAAGRAPSAAGSARAALAGPGPAAPGEGAAAAAVRAVGAARGLHVCCGRPGFQRAVSVRAAALWAPGNGRHWRWARRRPCTSRGRRAQPWRPCRRCPRGWSCSPPGWPPGRRPRWARARRCRRRPWRC